METAKNFNYSLSPFSYAGMIQIRFKGMFSVRLSRTPLTAQSINKKTCSNVPRKYFIKKYYSTFNFCPGLILLLLRLFKYLKTATHMQYWLV